MRKFLILSSLLYVLSIVPVAADEQASNLLDACGVLGHEKHWGPPGFGETPEIDKTFTVWLLRTNQPVRYTFLGERGLLRQGELTRLQLNIGSGKVKSNVLKALDGSLVHATGRIWPATSQGDTTDVVMDVHGIERMTSSGACAAGR